MREIETDSQTEIVTKLRQLADEIEAGKRVVGVANMSELDTPFPGVYESHSFQTRLASN